MAARLRRLSSLSEVNISDKWKEKPTESWFASADGSTELTKKVKGEDDNDDDERGERMCKRSKMFKGVKGSKVTLCPA